MTLDLNTDELSVLVDALSDKPYKEVSSLITKLTPPTLAAPRESTLAGIQSGSSTSNMLLG